MKRAMERAIVRKDKTYKDLIIFFNDRRSNRGMIVCYQEVGQHSEASLLYYWKQCAKVTKEEAQAFLDKYIKDYVIKEDKPILRMKLDYSTLAEYW